MKRMTMVALGAALVLSACSTFRDRGGSYQEAQDLPPTQLGEQVAAKELKPLYPIPPAVGEFKPVEKFVVPAPKPIVVEEKAAVQKSDAVSSVSELALIQDGNGYPSLQATGDFDQVWDHLGTALKAADIRIDDRNQSLGIYFVLLSESGAKKPEAFQLKVTRGSVGNSISLQNDEDTLAPAPVAKALFEKIQAKWPSGVNHGKA